MMEGFAKSGDASAEEAVQNVSSEGVLRVFLKRDQM